MNREEVFSKNVPCVRAVLKGKKIGIAGCGGLGSNLAQILTRMGADCFVLADFDLVEPSNLNRQFFFVDQVGRLKVEALRENLLRINPQVQCRIESKKIAAKNALDFFQDCAVVAECFDGAENKAMLVEALTRENKMVVAVSGVAGAASPESIKITRPLPNLILVGDPVAPDCSEGLICARVLTAAAMQAWAILDYLKDGTLTLNA
ncbi:MAG: sulfur carrier protein ThiS adenylyltransferase ThiF [Candidatus Margulisiibacteriota bacterium]